MAQMFVRCSGCGAWTDPNPRGEDLCGICASGLSPQELQLLSCLEEAIQKLRRGDRAGFRECLQRGLPALQQLVPETRE